MSAIHPTVSADWLREHLDDPQVVIVDCRFALAQPELGHQQYQTSHILGAYYLDLEQDLSSSVGLHGGRHPLPDIQELAAKLSAIGIHSQPPHGPTLVVAYDDSRFAFASRLWWLLRYLGHEQVVVLEGGFAGWQAANYATTAEIPPAQSGNFLPQPQANQVVDISDVQARKDLPGAVLIDSREGDRYRGEREPIDPVAGHIPGAVNYFWQDGIDAQGHFLPPAQQRDRWAKVADADEIMVYCGSGVTACVNLLSLAIAGISTGKLYPGSWSDWCSYPDLPIGTGEAKATAD